MSNIKNGMNIFSNYNRQNTHSLTSSAKKSQSSKHENLQEPPSADEFGNEQLMI
jgi:hypothetical protein